ncbi:MAG: hypothetical protein Q4B81_00160 [Moraxella sp.]|nr:hypothetical protein [Moraxella sp.]
MNHYQTKQSTHRYETGVIVGRYRDMPALIADKAGFDGLGVQTEVGGSDDAWCVLNLFDGLHRYIDSVAVNGAMDAEHAQTLALSQFNHLEPAYATIIAKDSDSFDGMLWSSTAIHRVLSSDKQDTHYLPIINKKQLATEESRVVADEPIWDGVNVLSHDGSLSKLFLDMQKHDAYHELVHPLDLKEMMDGATELGFDAIVESYNRLDLFKERLFSAMAKAPQDELKVANVTMTKPFKRQGVANVAVVFELSDGQSISIWFHNPDANPAKLRATDTMASWKWLLNARDVTAALSPPNGENVQLPTLARRMMLLAAKNTKRFAAAQKKKRENQARLQAAEDEVNAKITTIERLDEEIGTLQARIDAAVYHATKADDAPTTKEVLVDVDNEVIGVTDTPDERLHAKVESPVIHNPQESNLQADEEPVVLTGKEFGEFDLSSDEGMKALREKVSEHLNGLRGETVFCKALNADVEIRKKGIKKYLSTSSNPIKLQIAGSLLDIIKNGKVFKPSVGSYAKKEQSHGVKYHYLKAPFVINGTEYGARVVIREDKEGKFHYDLQVRSTVDAILDGIDPIKNPSVPNFQKVLAVSDFSNIVYQDDFQVKDSANVILDGLDMKNAEWVSANKSDLIQHWLNDNVNFVPCQDAILDNLDDDAMLDSLKSGYVLNLFIFDKDGNEIKDEPTDNQETTTYNQVEQPQILGATLEWTEANFDENIKFDNLEALQAWFNKTYTKEFFEEDASPYFKNKLIIDFGADDSVTMRIDVNGRAEDLKDDYNPLKFSLVEWLEHNYQSFSRRGFGQNEIDEPKAQVKLGLALADEPILSDNAKENKQPPQEQVQEIVLSELVIDKNASKNEIYEQVSNWLKDNLQGKVITTVDGKKVTFNRKYSIDHLSHDGRRSVLASQAIAHIADVFTKGEFVGREELSKERKDKFVAFHAYEKQVDIDGKKVLLQAKAGEKADGTLQTLETLIAYRQKVKSMMDGIDKEKGHFLLCIKSMDLKGELALCENNSTLFDSLQETEATLTILQILDENGNDITHQEIGQEQTQQHEYRPQAKDLTFVGQEFDHTPTGDNYTVWGLSKQARELGLKANGVVVETVNMGKKITTKELADKVASVMQDKFKVANVEIRSDNTILQGGVSAIANAFGAGGLQNKQDEQKPHPHYNQDDLEYLNDIITGKIDPLAVDFDRLIAIGEKDESDPLFEQANNVISAALDEATKGV